VNRWYYAAWGLLSIVMFGGVLALGLKTEDRKGGVPEPTATEHASSPSSHLPPARPEYARTFQGIVDAARPKGEGRIIVKGCYAGRQGNEHFCVWVAPKGCEAGFIQEQPGNGTVPVQTGRVPIPVRECNIKGVMTWLRRLRS